MSKDKETNPIHLTNPYTIVLGISDYGSTKEKTKKLSIAKENAGEYKSS